jgi:hypothetical protein
MSFVKKVIQASQKKSEDDERSLVPHKPKLAYEEPKKVAIIGLEVRVDLIAQFNPKEVTIEKSTTWEASENKKADLPDLEFSAAGGRTLSMELLFDGYEGNEDVAELYVSKLMQLCSVMDPDGAEQHKRPSMVQLQWPQHERVPFEGVITSVSTKYTMFSACGKPVRATCSIKMSEARRSFKGEPDRIGPPEWKRW